MSENLIQISSRKFTIENFLASLLAVILINTVIAVILTAIGFGLGFVPAFIFSQCIGTSIYLCNHAAFPIYRKATSLAVQVTVIAVFIMVGASVGTLLGALANGLHPLLFLREHSVLFFQSILVGLLFGSIVSYVFISLGAISQEKIERLNLEKGAAEAELKLLQSQMEPHFLFNTLSNAISLIDTDRDRARRMLESFTSFLRGSLLTARERTVSLSQEIEIIRNYLEVFSVRMGDRLSYVIDVPDSLKSCRIPPLLIQPLVENAVKHGLEPAARGGKLSIRTSQVGDTIKISVTDTGKGISEKTSGSGIGLENVKKRLELFYGRRGLLLFEENKPTGVKVTIEIPYETDAGNHR